MKDSIVSSQKTSIGSRLRIERIKLKILCTSHITVSKGMHQSIYAECLSERKKARTISGITKKNTCTRGQFPNVGPLEAEPFQCMDLIYGMASLHISRTSRPDFNMFKRCLKTQLIFNLCYTD